MKAIIGRKVGMTQIFDDRGQQVPVTVLEAGPCTVIQRKRRDREGYDAVQLGFGERPLQRLNKPMRGHCGRTRKNGFRVLREVRLDEGEDIGEGETLTVEIFSDVAFVDVTGLSKGRGFQGVVKRYGMGGGRGSHGSMTHRRVGAIGQCAMPSRVFKNKKMPGRTGHRRVTVQNLRVVGVRREDNAILVKGAVPGPNGGLVMIREAVKRRAGNK
ncbi:MAG TPA: 50S ribosomal protein L3 [Kiritimatiellae bacterium]|nr:50S ribosomal protein L3 [Kiritimatiellia bacterium]